MIKENKIPHLLFYGPPGTGKTSTILACINEIYDQNYNSLVIHLNASDERGIDVVRDRIKDFCSAGLLFIKNKKKLVILDEADSMTHDAQLTLRQIIVKYSKTVKFCLICNYIYKIIPQLQSRFSKFRFKTLDNKLILKKIKFILNNEKIQYDNNSINILSKNSNGDMRKIINILQFICIKEKKINNEILLKNGIYIENFDIEKITNNLINNNLKNNINMLYDYVDKNYLLDDIINNVISQLFLSSLSNKELIYILVRVSELQSSNIEQKNRIIYFTSLFKEIKL